MDYYFLVQCNLNTVVCHSIYCFNIKSNFWLVMLGLVTSTPGFPINVCVHNRIFGLRIFYPCLLVIGM